MKRSAAVLLAIALLPLAACSPETTATSATFSQVAPDTSDPCPPVDDKPQDGDAGIEVAGTDDGEPAITLPGGEQECTFLFSDLRFGDGDEVKAGDTIRAHYVGMSWKANKTFDSSWSGDPIEFPLDRTIPGWQQAIPGMKEGGRRLLVVPPALAYEGETAPVVAWDTLVFVVDVIEIL